MPTYLSQANLVRGMYLWYVPREERLSNAVLARVDTTAQKLVFGEDDRVIDVERLGLNMRSNRVWRASIEDEGWFFIPIEDDVEPPPPLPKEEKRAKRCVADIPPEHREGVWLRTPSPTKKEVHHVLFDSDDQHSLCFRIMSGQKRAWKGEIYVCGLCRRKLARRLGLPSSG